MPSFVVVAVEYLETKKKIVRLKKRKKIKKQTYLGGWACQGTPNLNPQLCPSSTVCISTPSPTSDKDWLTPFLHFLHFSVPLKLQNSETPSLCYAKTPLCSHFVSLFLCFSATSFPSFFSSFSSLFICFFAFLEL